MALHNRNGRKDEPREHVPCAHDGCPDPAILFRKIRGSTVKLCKRHDLFHVQQDSDEFVRSLGLNTIDEKRAWCISTLRSPKPTPAEHWQSVLQMHGLLPIAYQMARDYLRNRGIEREPGQEG